MNEAIQLAISNETISILELMLEASLLVQIVMALLIIVSLASWVVIFTKASTLKNMRQQSDDFDSEFWSGGELNGLYRRYTEEGADPLGMASIFVAGYREYNRLAGNGAIDRAELVDGVHRAMRVALSREIEVLESRLSFLATVGSTSPYVGLFGTVWGIMNSFQAIALSKNTSLVVVAPGIAEALFATALGLLAAIPAVLAFNKLSKDLDRYAGRLDSFAGEFSAILSRQMEEKD